MPVYYCCWILALLAGVFATTDASSAAAPWQDTTTAAASLGGGMDQMPDLPPTLFSPTGRLPAVERVLQQAVGSSSSSSAAADASSQSTLVFALQCANGIAVVTTVPQSPYLHVPTPKSKSKSNTNTTISCSSATNTTGNNTTNTTTNTTDSKLSETETQTTSLLLLLDNQSVPAAPFTQLTANTWGVTGGHSVQARVVQRYWHDLASDLRRQQQQQQQATTARGTTAAVLARRWADVVQHATQHLPGSNSYGLLAVQGIFFSSSSLRTANDKVLWRVDPSGQFFRCTAAVVGWGSQSIEQHFLTELLASTAKGAEDTAVSNEPTAKKLSAASVREILSKWTVEQALGVAADCIRAAQAKKQRPQGISSSDSTRPMLQLQGMSLVDNKVTWYNATQLEALGETADWS